MHYLFLPYELTGCFSNIQVVTDLMRKHTGIKRFLQKNGIRYLEKPLSTAPKMFVFLFQWGRGENRLDSDIDFLVDVSSKTSSWFLAGLVLDLEEITGQHVEVVTEKGMNPYIREYVLREAVVL